MKPTLPACLPWQMMTRLVVLGLLCLGIAQTTKAQVLFNYTNLTSGVGTPAANMSATALTRGVPEILQASDCMANQGFGSHGWPTTNVFNVATFNANGWYVEFTLTPDPGYGLKVTGFTSRSRRENQAGTADDGPIAMRYGYTKDGINWVTVNPGNPLSSNLCTSSGVNRTWPGFTSVNSSDPVTFRIYGLSGGSNRTGDMFLQDIVVNGEVCANAPSITPAPANFLVCAGETTASSLYVLKDADTYAINFDAAAEAEGFVDVTETPLAAAPNAISWTIPAGADPGVYNAVVTVANECGFKTEYDVDITVAALPDVSASLSASSICVGGNVTLTFDDEANTLHTFHISFDLVDDNGTTPIEFFSVQDGASLNLTEGVNFYGAISGTVSITNIVVEDETTECTSEPSDISLTIIPEPDVDVTLDDMDICDDGEVTLTFTDNDATGHLFSITADLVDDNGTFVGAINYTGIPSGATDTYTEGIDFEGSVNGVVSLTNIVVTDETTGCSTELADLTITVNPYPVASFTVVSSPLCPGELVEIYFNESAWSGGTEFTVGGDASPLVFGLDTLTLYEVINGDHIDLTEGTDFTGNLTVSQITVTEPISGCSASASNVTVDVLPAPSFGFNAASENYGPDQGSNVPGQDTVDVHFCDGNHLTLSGYTDNGSIGYTYVFTTTGNVTYDGVLFPLSGGPANVAPNDAATFFGQVYGGALGYGLNSGTSGAINQTFTPYLDNDNSGTFTPGDCEGEPIYLIYHIHAVPTVTVSPDPIELCDGEEVTVAFTGNYGAGATYTWTNDNASIGMAVSGSGDVTFTAANTGNTTVVANVTVTPSTNYCSGTPVNFTITVYPKPTASVNAAVAGGTPQTVNNSNANHITLDFCVGESFSFSGYSGTPGMGFIEEITTGTTNVTGVPVPRAPSNIPPASVAGFFSGTYGPYTLSSGTYGWFDQVYTPYFDVNNDGDYDAGIDCLGEPFTITYRIYAPISLTVTRDNGGTICSGDGVQYTISTTSTEDVTFDLVFEENANAGNPADLDDDNIFPAPTTHTISAGNPYVFTATVNNAMGSFDRGRVRVRAINIGYADADVCTTADVNGQNTQVYPEPRLAPISDILLSCDGNQFILDVDMLGLPSLNAAQAGYPVRIDWVVSGAGVNENGATGSAVIYNGAGAELNELQQVLSLVDPQQGAQTVTLTITPRASGPTNAFNGDDCIGDPIYVDVEVVPSGEPEIDGPTCVYVGSTIQLTGTPNVQSPATFVSDSWSDDGSGRATVDQDGVVTGGPLTGPTTIYYNVTDNAGCVTTASYQINVLSEVVLTSVYTGGSVACGEEFTVSVQVSNFCDIGTLDYYFSWDPNEFQYVTSVVSPVPDGFGTISTLNVGNGELVYSFGSTANSGGTSLNDGTVIFTYTLRAIGAAGTYNVPETIVELNAYNSNFSQVGSISTGISIQVTNISLDLGPNPVICPSEDFIHLTYTNVGGNPDVFIIDFDAPAEAAGFPDTQQGVFDPNDGEILIPVPANIGAGSYHGTLVLSNSTYGCESNPYLITMIVDQTPPTASNPAPTNLQCLSAIPAPNPAVVIDEDDDCPTDPVVAYVPGLSTETGTGCAGDPKIINRVYSVTDGAGNTIYVTHTITVEDNIPPTISTSGLAAWYPSGLAAVNAAIARANATKIDGNGCTAPVGITVEYNSIASDTSGCNGVIVLVVKDACGNITPAVNATYYVTIDRTPPVATAGVIDECYDADETPTGPYGDFDYAVQAALAATSATDDCDNNLTFTAATTGTDCNLTITVTVTDDCGRTATAVYNTRVDSDGPTFDIPLAQLELEMDGDCFDTEQEALDAAIDIVELHVGDDCGPLSSLQFDAFANGGCPAEIMVVVTDFCGNPSTVTFTGVHIDTEDPKVDPDPIYATCFKTLAEAYDSLSKAVHPYDNCSTEEELLASVIPNSFQTSPVNSACKEYYIEFTFTDNCGNSVLYPYETIVIDNVAPTAQPMSTLSYTCLDDVDAPDTGTVVASDNCGVQDIIWVSDVLPTSCPGTGTRTYRVFDCAGNSLDVVQTISVNDNIAPTWTTVAGDLNRQPSCDDQSSIDDALSLEPEAEDNCGEVSVVLESSTPTNSCAGGYIRTWRAYDECGNTSTTVFTQTIVIVDNDAPTWVTTPYDIDTQVECSDEDALDAALDLQPVADDVCGTITYQMVEREYTEYVECINGYLGEWVTEWVAEDACGNESVSFFHYVYIYDNTAPQWETAPNALNGTISCSDIPGYDYLNSLFPVAEDNCDQDLVYDKVPGQFVAGGDCPGEGSFTNTWIAYDKCSNQSTTFTQVITVVDNTPPTFDPGCQFMPLNLYTSPDGGPAANCAAGVSLEVGDILDYQTGWTVAGVPIASLDGCIGDDCSPLSGIVVEVVSIQETNVDNFQDGQNVYDCVRQITISFQLTDACGNVQPTLFVCVYNIIDNTRPEVYCPDGGGPTLPSSCYSSVAAAEADAREAIDPCDNCTDAEDLEVSVSTVGTCNAEITVTVSDCAGNEDTYTFNTRIDGEAPMLTASNIQLCYNTVAEAQAAAIAGTTITDNCDPYGNLNISTAVNGTCPASITVTATDQCGNSRSIVYNGICIGMASQVEISDEADNLNVDCVDWQTDLNNWLANHGGAVAPGNDIQWSYQPLDPATMLQNSMPNCTTHTKSVVVTFRATNACGNFDETTATFSVTDNVPPTANLIANTNLTCSGGIPAPNLELVTGEADNCGGTVTVSLFGTSDNMAAGCPNSPRIVIHQYMVTDAYCNTALINHTITVVDNVAPTFTVPANITINVNAGCSYNATTAVTGDVTDESDNCTPSGPGLQAYYTEVINPGNSYQVKYVISRTWYLTDACGNSAIPKVQTITVLDVTAPTIVGCPANMTLPGTTIENACGAYFGAQTNPAFNDNCSGATIAYELSGATQGTGSGYLQPTDVFLEGTTTVTYIVEDAVGNTASCSFTVSVNCLTISGRIIWEHDGVSGVKDATVNVTNVLPTPAFGGSDLSDTNGNYDVSVPVNGTYKVRPVKNINRLNGVTSADATAINNHVNLSNPITNPYKKVCADVNRSGIIQTQDATLITQCLAGNPTALNIFNVFWRFVPTNFVMPATPHQNVPVFPDFKDVTLAGMDAVNIDFYGMKIGDVAAPWANPQNAPIAPLVWMVKDQQLETGSDIELTFNVTNFTDLSSYQFALDFDPTILKFDGFEPLTALPLNLLDNFGAYNADMGELRHVWAAGGGVDLAEGTAVFRAKFKVLAGGQKLSEVLRLDDSQIECKAFNRNLVATELRLVFTETTAVDVPTDLNHLELQLMQNRPNPFVDATTIGFILPEACEAHIRILDISGRELTSYDRKYTAGYHELDFKMENASFYGVLFCELTTPQGKRTIKMLTAK
ncbi:MAG TPA: HYR domain-containing protein [Saprospiraceae bacterium]|nr:HYR domain-containing protein [Saprospiraceae bacterium]